MMDSAEEAWLDLSSLPADPPEMRAVCLGCGRPEMVCWCESLPAEAVSPQSRVIVLQHPAEEKRSLKTAPMLVRALAPGKCLLYRGKKFPSPKHAGLAEILQAPNTVLLYPSKSALDLRQFPKVSETGVPYNVLVIDGTWPQAKGIFYNTPALRNVKQGKLRDLSESVFVIRSQPTIGCLSTLETAAEALSILETQDYREPLLKPLKTLCDFQLSHGAVTHHPAHLRNGPDLRPLGRRLARFLRALQPEDS